MKLTCVKAVLLLALMLTVSCARPRPSTPPGSVHVPPGNSRVVTPKPGKPSVDRPSARPAVFDRMIAKAEQQLRLNDPAAAFQTLERALAIDGRDPLVWHLMAEVRLSQGNYAQALALARKSNTLAGNRPDIRQKNGQVIARAKALQ